MLDQPQDQVGRAYRRLDAQQLEELAVPRVVDPGDDPRAEVFSFASWQIRRLSSSSPETAIVRSARLMPGPLEDPELGGVPVDRVLELLLDGEVAERSLSMTVTSLPLAMSSRARFHPTFPAPAMTTYTARPPRARARTSRSRSSSDRCVKALLGVPLCPRGVHDTTDHPAPRMLARDLRDGEVRVVAVGRGDEVVGLLDAGLAQRVDLQAVAEREAAARVLPRRVHPGVEALVGERVLVQDGDLMAGGEHRARDRGADAAGADDQDEGHRGGL